MQNMDPGSNRSYVNWNNADPGVQGGYHQNQQYAGYSYVPAEQVSGFQGIEYPQQESFGSYPQPAYAAPNCQFAQILPTTATFATPITTVGSVGGVFHVETHYAGAMSHSAGARASTSKRRGSSSRKRNSSSAASDKVQRSLPSSVADLDDIQSVCTRDESDDEGSTLTSSRMSPLSETGLEEPRKGGTRQNHSEIEKRRRDKMNKYITELSRVVPMCITMSHKLDKLTVLRMAVQHLKTIRGAVHSYTEGDYKPSFLSDEELKRLILQSADGFLFVVGCDRGRILYVSESVSQVLNFSQGELLGQSWFDILHPKDVAKVKEQLFSSDLSPRERFIDAKTMLPVKTDVPQGASLLCPGARRSFFCRMKSKAPQFAKDDADLCTPTSSKQRKSQNVSKEKKFVVVHCTGYLKSWAPTKIGVHDQDSDGDIEACNLSCLVAVGRVQPSSPSCRSASRASQMLAPAGYSRTPESQSSGFTSRHAVDGKFIFVDQRATLLLGILPQEMLGSSMYEYFHVDDIPALTEAHKTALQSTEAVLTPVYRFKIKEGSYVRLQSQWKSFRNPWTKEIECLIAKNNSVPSEATKDVMGLAMDQSSSNPELYSTGSSSVPDGNIGSRVRMMCMEFEANKIGQAVADEVLDAQRRSFSTSCSSAGPSPLSLVSSSNASPFSNMGSPTDSDAAALAALVTGSSMEDSRRSALSAGHNIHGGLNGLVSSGATQQRANQPTGLNQGSNNHSASSLRNNTQLFHVLNEAGLHADEDMMEVIGGLLDQSQSPSEELAGGDGNDEAAMAVVMSLLEADAGLGGPVDFSGLPWPLP